MKISFPHMGISYIAFKHLLEELGYEVIVPPNPTKRTLTYGVKYAPEFACMPFKILLGNYIEVLEKGAEILITSGGVGPCRAGLYGVVHEKILKDIGYEFSMIVLEPPLENFRDFSKRVLVLKQKGIRWTSFLHEVKNAWMKLKLLDKVEQTVNKVRARELNKGQTTKVFNEVLKMIDEARSREEIFKVQKEAIDLLNSVPQDFSREPLKVGIIGEIYVVLEPHVNFDIERFLGERDVYVDRSIYITDYVRFAVWDKKGEDHIKKAAQPYLKQMIGGHGIQSVGETVLYALNGYDGVIQLAPFTCIPEIVSKSILAKVSRDLDIPVLTINIDEQTGEAGVQTRLEAFIDLIKQKKYAKEHAKEKEKGRLYESVYGY
ncbi:MAG: CoA protein activase [Clostridia bacterium]|nr:CoA protein activase [Clostridia bacterium]